MRGRFCTFTGIENGEELNVANKLFDFLNDSGLFMQLRVCVPYLKQVVTFSNAHTQTTHFIT